MPRKRQSTKSRIVKSAWNLFYKNGYDNTTVEDIITASKTSKGTFYHYFKSKEGLLNSLSYLFDEKYEDPYNVVDPNLSSYDKLLFLNHELFYMIETSVDVKLVAYLYSAQLVTKDKRSLSDHKRFYYVWLSEIMLQQTRVSAALPYYERFLAALPDIPALAACEEEKLNKLWEGLGYYSRVRNLQKAARIVCEQYGGELPADYAALRALPGIGDYTAGAIASISFGLPVPAVDGNVLRVFSRLYNDPGNITEPPVKKAFTERVMAHQPPDAENVEGIDRVHARRQARLGRVAAQRADREVRVDAAELGNDGV